MGWVKIKRRGSDPALVHTAEIEAVLPSTKKGHDNKILLTSGKEVFCSDSMDNLQRMLQREDMDDER